MVNNWTCTVRESETTNANDIIKNCHMGGQDFSPALAVMLIIIIKGADGVFTLPIKWKKRLLLWKLLERELGTKCRLLGSHKSCCLWLHNHLMFKKTFWNVQTEEKVLLKWLSQFFCSFILKSSLENFSRFFNPLKNQFRKCLAFLCSSKWTAGSCLKGLVSTWDSDYIGVLLIW